MARKRINEAVFRSWDEVDNALHIVADAENELAKIEAEMNQTICTAKEQADAAAAPHKEEIKKQEELIREYVTEHKSELSGKSRKMTFGVVGFRLSTKLKLPKALDGVIAALKRNCMQDCITIKETVNKDILKTYNEKEILSVGGTLVKEDTFYYEIARVEMQPAK